MHKNWWLLGVGLVCWWGCNKPSQPQPVAATPPPPPPQTNSVQPTYHLNHEQPTLPTIKLYVGAKELNAEIASTITQIATGMMFRKQLGTNAGMLFVFSYPHRASFYMKNTIVPLSAAYIDPEGVIQEIVELKPLDESPAPASSENIQFVLEVNQGWFKENGIGPGTVLTTDRGTLKETFFRR